MADNLDSIDELRRQALEEEIIVESSETYMDQARSDRLHGAEGIIPLPVWIVLFLLSALIFAYVLFFADPDERALTQGMLMGSVSVVVALLMLLLLFFNDPHGEGLGTLRPTAMERSLSLIQAQVEIVGLDITPPCDAKGRPL